MKEDLMHLSDKELNEKIQSCTGILSLCLSLCTPEGQNLLAYSEELITERERRKKEKL